MPLDINTITFLINPAYTLNGSLDGMVGSTPADPTFYSHVPALRAQHGSRFPASYFRLKEAYDIRKSIDQQDKDRESFFYNFDANNIDNIDEIARQSAGTPAPSTGGITVSTNADGQPDTERATADANKQGEEANADLEARKNEIKAKYTTLADGARASAAFADWQIRLEAIRTRAGKRNIVNMYVWDGDGGLRAEEQNFASTIEHSINTTFSGSFGLGFSGEGTWGPLVYSYVKFSLLGSIGGSTSSSRTLTTGKSLALSVDLSGVEGRNINDLRDKPLFPGEKVDRYRFMSFYLEGNTGHFNDFFNYVVDPEWLASNDEEARSLRQAMSQTNECWRVLHRVTYVERPALGTLDNK